MPCAWMRALTSTPPPAANGTTRVIGRVGQSCAPAGETAAIANAAANSQQFHFISRSVCVRQRRPNNRSMSVEFERHVSRPAVIALAGIRRRLHLAQ